MQRVTFTSARGEMVELYHKPLFLKEITGLGDVTSETKTQKAPNQDGSTPVSTELNERTIYMEIVILEELLQHRQRLSRIFNPRLGAGVLTYDNGLVQWSIKAISEHVPTFPDDRPRKVQTAFIDLICYDPYFRDANDVRTDIAFWESKFMFPLEIDHEMGVEMGARSPTLIVNVENIGHADTGMTIKFVATKTVVNPTITNVDTGEFIKITRTLVPGEILTVNTNARQKSITSEINGVVENVFNDIVFGSKFLQLMVGDNLFRYGADQYEEFLEVSIYHSNKYAGV